MFTRTACFFKEKMKDGKTRIYRIPWDILSHNGSQFMVSPTPIRIESELSSTADDFLDLVHDADIKEIDPIVSFEFFASEADFYSKYETTFGYYTSNASKEFGYPLASNL